MKRSTLRSMATLVAMAAALALSAPARAVPDASRPMLLGVNGGAELGFAGKGVSDGLPYDLYLSAAVAHLAVVRGELLGGGSRKTMTNISLGYSILPLPLINVLLEPGITNAGSGTGPSLGLRATETLPATNLRFTAYGRVHRVSGETTTEIGAGADYPIGTLVRVSLSAIHFNGGFEPDGNLFLAGIKAKIGV